MRTSAGPESQGWILAANSPLSVGEFGNLSLHFSAATAAAVVKSQEEDGATQTVSVYQLDSCGVSANAKA